MGLKFLIPGFFLVGEFGKILGSADCIVRVISCIPFWKFFRLANLAWDFFGGVGVKFWSRDFFGLWCKP